MADNGGKTDGWRGSDPFFSRLHVLYEDNHLLVVAKPAMLPTMGVGPGKPSLLDAAKEYIRQKYAKPGNVYLGVVSRLDAPVTGVVLFARTSKGAGRLAEQFRARKVEKMYWAAVEGGVDPPADELVHFVRKDERHRRVHVTHAGADGAQEARLQYHLLAHRGDDSLIEVALETGRKHQIRVQLAKVGHPVLGDQKYGAVRPFPRGIALHARRLVVIHPVRREPLELVAPLPNAWRKAGLDWCGD